jgi:hypothetical protein
VFGNKKTGNGFGLPPNFKIDRYIRNIEEKLSSGYPIMKEHVDSFKLKPSFFAKCIAFIVEIML